ncbi:MAG TPA: DNA gyrase inhibitor YacG [Pseudomonadales bacterium]|nr:DNA gyrase inhibitor YacG [Gammaproteobacteria bacterium]HIM34301.1 DNA gyrase inhibitor YacG [Pseudomonadales bacterium]
MPEKTTQIVPCPTCKKVLRWTVENEFRPFCSERCRLIDFGAWADEKHAIPGERNFDDLGSSDSND